MNDFIKMLGVVLLVVLGYIVWSTIQDTIDNKHEKLMSIYKDIKTTHELELNARFIGYNKTVVRGVDLVNFSDSLYLFIGGATRNYAYKPETLGNFFQQNDSIFKRANSDTLYVYRGEQEYYFIIGKIINRK